MKIMNTNSVWMITGCSSGFGKELAKKTIKAGYKVVVTARNLNSITDLVEKNSDQVLALELDVTKPDQIKNAVDATIEKFGRIDVLVNNAGVGYFSSIEEAAEEETRKMFEINFWGLAHMTQAVLPYMRKQLSGHIINISSIGGLVSFPGVGFYNGTKYAVEGLSESLAQEVAPFHIQVTLIEPSNFRTNWSGSSASKTASTIREYEELISPFITGEIHGNEPGDPAKAAEAIVSMAETSEPPLRLLLGTEAYFTVVNKYESSLKNFEHWKEVSLSADFHNEQK